MESNSTLWMGNVNNIMTEKSIRKLFNLQSKYYHINLILIN